MFQVTRRITLALEAEISLVRRYALQQALTRMEIVDRTLTTAAAALVYLLAGPVAADDLTDAAQELCNMVKSCALEQMAEQDLTPEMREMMTPMLENMCATMRRQVKEVPVGHGLYDPAVACLRSMASLTCADLQDAGRVETPQCKEYAEKAQQAGIAKP